MNITINIPSLDRLCDILQEGIRISIPEQPAPAVEEPIRLTPEVKNKKKAAPAPEPEPAKEFVAEDEEEDETPTTVVKMPTVESLTALAKQFIAYSTPAALRALLDEAGIKGEKISTCSSAKYPAIEAALQAALEMGVK